MFPLRVVLLSTLLLVGGLQTQAEDDVIDLQELLVKVSNSLVTFSRDFNNKFTGFTNSLRTLSEDMRDMKTTLEELRKSTTQLRASNDNLRQAVEISSENINTLGQNMKRSLQELSNNQVDFQQQVKSHVELSARNLATFGQIMEEQNRNSVSNFRSFEQLLREISKTSTGTCPDNSKKYEEIVSKLDSIKDISNTINTASQKVREEIQKTSTSLNSIIQSQKEIKETVSTVKEVTTNIQITNNQIQQGSDTCSASLEAFLKDYKVWKESLTEKIDKVVEKQGSCDNGKDKDKDKDKDNESGDKDEDKGQDIGLVTDCWDVYKKYGYRTNGLYNVRPAGFDHAFPAFCDMSDGGGWLLIQRRGDYGNPTDFFYKGWNNYKLGFGSSNKELWLGNDKIAAITGQREYELKIDLWDYDQTQVHARYNNFRIGDEYSRYTLRIGGYSGNAGNALKEQNGMMFSTYDKDNRRSKPNCGAEEAKTGWWHGNCDANLNGLRGRGVKWLGSEYSFGVTTMMIRPKGV